MANVNTAPSQGLQTIQMSKDFTDAVDILCASILQAINEKSKYAGYDRTFQSVVTAVNGSNTYTILDSGNEIENVPAYVGTQKITVGSSVYVKIPSGNRSKIHICNVIK